jgi:putative hydrolase of the HAD superfamily
VRTFSGIRAVAFDAVGTLIHPRPPAPVVYEKVGRGLGSQLSAQVITGRFRAAFQREEDLDRRHQYRTSEAREAERWRNIVFDVLTDVTDPETCFNQLFDHFARRDSWVCSPVALQLVDRLRAEGFSLAIASNYDRRLRSVIEGIAPFRGIPLVISSEVGCRKPANQFFTALCDTLGARPSEVLYVGDDPINDYAGAGSSGLQAVLFDPQQRAAVANRMNALMEILDLLDVEKKRS